MRISDWSSDVCSSDLFLVNRFARLYPAYLVAMLLTLGIESLARVSQLLIGSAAILANVTMLQGFAFLPEVDGAYWTLTVEIAFYACMLSIWKYTGLRRLELLLLGWLAARWLYALRSEEHTSELQSLMRISYAVFCL